MPLPTLWSESLFRTSGSRLRKSARSPKVAEPPDRGGPEALPELDPPPPPQAATTATTAATRIPSDRLRMASLPLPETPGQSRTAGWRQLTPSKIRARRGNEGGGVRQSL